jgi:hypothetical protein
MKKFWLCALALGAITLVPTKIRAYADCQSANACGIHATRPHCTFTTILRATLIMCKGAAADAHSPRGPK